MFVWMLRKRGAMIAIIQKFTERIYSFSFNKTWPIWDNLTLNFQRWKLWSVYERDITHSPFPRLSFAEYSTNVSLVLVPFAGTANSIGEWRRPSTQYDATRQRSANECFARACPRALSHSCWCLSMLPLLLLPYNTRNRDEEINYSKLKYSLSIFSTIAQLKCVCSRLCASFILFTFGVCVFFFSSLFLFLILFSLHSISFCSFSQSLCCVFFFFRLKFHRIVAFCTLNFGLVSR